MAKFDPMQPGRLMHDAMNHFLGITLAKTARDYCHQYDAVHDDGWLKRLDTMRLPFIEAAGKADLDKTNAIAAWRKLWEAALRIRRDAGDLVTVFTVIGNKKLDAGLGEVGTDLGGQWTVTEEDRRMHAFTMNRKLFDSVSEQYYIAINAFGELASCIRPKPAKRTKAGKKSKRATVLGIVGELLLMPQYSGYGDRRKLRDELNKRTKKIYERHRDYKKSSVDNLVSAAGKTSSPKRKK